MPTNGRRATGTIPAAPRTKMNVRRLAAWVLIALGTLALLSRVGPGTGWLWVALAAAGFLVAYRREGTYPFLVVGAVLAGMAAGLLLEGAWGWRGAFLMSLGAGFLAIDRIEPRASRWPIYPAAVLVGVGLVYWLFRTGVLQSFWFPFLLIVAGVYLLRRTGDGWVEVGERAEGKRATDERAQAEGTADERADAEGTASREGSESDDPSARDEEREGPEDAARGRQPQGDRADDRPPPNGEGRKS
jgi:hypothetical protein